MTRTERQLLAIDRWKQANFRASIVAATGVGKTRIALMAIEKFLVKNPTKIIRVIVPTKILKDQWEEKIDEMDLMGNIKVVVLNTAANSPFYCDFLIVDEIHRSNSLVFRQLFKNCNPRLILGLTATYERLDGFEKEVVDHYCPVCDTITIEEATQNGWLAPYTEYKVLIEVNLSEYNKANRDFIRYFNFFGYDFNLAMSAVTNVFIQQKLAKQYNCSLSEVRAMAYGWNKALRFRKDFIANHPKKFEIARKIINSRSDLKIITFNNSIKQCESYNMGYVLHSGNTKKKNRMTLEEFSLCKDGVLHTSKMADEGLDVKGLSVAIITGFNSSKISKRQRINVKTQKNLYLKF